MATPSALALIVNVSTGLAAPVLPLFARSLGASYAEAGLLVSSFYLARLTVDLVAGAVVDRWGESRCAVGGLALLAAGGAILWTVSTYWLALAGWAVAGTGSALVYAAMFTKLLRAVPGERVGRALTVFYAAFNGGLIVGGLFGSVIVDRFGLRAPFLVLAVAAVVAGFVAYSLLRTGESVSRPESPRARISLDRIRDLFLHTRAAVPAITLFAELWGVGSILTLVPLFARYILKLPPGLVGVLYAIYLCGELAMLYPAGRLTDTRGRRWVLVRALSVSAICFFAIGWLPFVTPFVAILIVLSIANGFVGVPPAAMLSDVVPDEFSGIGVGAFRFGGDLGFTVAPVTVAAIAGSFGFGPAFVVAGIPSVAAFALVAAGSETLKDASRRFV